MDELQNQNIENQPLVEANRPELAPENPAKPPRSRSKKLFIIGGAVALVIIVAAAVFLLTQPSIFSPSIPDIIPSPEMRLLSAQQADLQLKPIQVEKMDRDCRTSEDGRLGCDYTINLIFPKNGATESSIFSSYDTFLKAHKWLEIPELDGRTQVQTALDDYNMGYDSQADYYKKVNGHTLCASTVVSNPNQNYPGHSPNQYHISLYTEDNKHWSDSCRI
jgi:hypothetical protein